MRKDITKNDDDATAAAETASMESWEQQWRNLGEEPMVHGLHGADAMIFPMMDSTPTNTSRTAAAAAAGTGTSTIMNKQKTNINTSPNEDGQEGESEEGAASRRGLSWQRLV